MIVIKNRRCDNLDIPRQMSKVADADRPRRTLTSLTPDPSPSVVPVIHSIHSVPLLQPQPYCFHYYSVIPQKTH